MAHKHNKEMVNVVCGNCYTVVPMSRQSWFEIQEGEFTGYCPGCGIAYF